MLEGAKVTAIYLDSGKRVEVLELGQDASRPNAYFVRVSPTVVLLVPTAKIQSMEVVYPTPEEADKVFER